MFWSKVFIPTLKDSPQDAEVISHQLMLRAGMIRKVSSGIYTWLPLGLKVLRKIENIVREEMDQSGAQEVLMPMVHPKELWEETKRWVVPPAKNPVAPDGGVGEGQRARVVDATANSAAARTITFVRGIAPHRAVGQVERTGGGNAPPHCRGGHSPELFSCPRS